MREPRKWGEHAPRGTLAVSPRAFYELVCAPRRRGGIGGWITTCDTGDDTCERVALSLLNLDDSAVGTRFRCVFVANMNNVGEHELQGVPVDDL